MQGELLSKFQEAGREALVGLSETVDALAEIVLGFGPERFQFALPGDLEVQRMFGNLGFNRITGEWAVDFGGRLFFDDYNLAFEVLPPTGMMSDGSFNLSLATDGPVPFGFEDTLELSTAFTLSGNALTPQLDSAMASGDLIHTPEGGTPGNYQISLDYDYEDPPGSHNFEVETTFEDQHPLFTNEIVIFEGGFGFALSTDANGMPLQGGVEAGMTLGILLREEAAMNSELLFSVATPSQSDRDELDNMMITENLQTEFANNNHPLSPTAEVTVLAAGNEWNITDEDQMFKVKVENDMLNVSTSAEELTLEDFWLKFVGRAKLEFSTVDETVQVSLESGELFLPSDLFSHMGDPTMPAQATLRRPLCVKYDFGLNQISFCDSPDPDKENPGVVFENIVFAIPGLDEGKVTITTADLSFNPLLPIPVLEKLDASVTLPLPGSDSTQSDQTTTVTIDVLNWPITGLPEAVSIALEQPLTLLDLEGFTVQVLANEGTALEDGGGNVICPTGLSFTHNQETNETTFSIASNMKVEVNPDMIAMELDETGEPVAGEDEILSASTGGCFSWTVGQIPSFILGDLTFEGHFRLGGDPGVEFKGARGESAASVSFANINNIFERNPVNVMDAFRITLQGAVNFADFIEFSLLESAFIWDGSVNNPLTGVIDNRFPRFEPGGVCAEIREEGIDLIDDFLPLYPTELCLRFKENTLPLLPQGDPPPPGLFYPTNLVVLASGVITLPNGAAIEGGSPGISGAVEGVEIQFMADELGLPVPDFPTTVASIDSLTLQIENLDVPPIGAIAGGLHIGNIDKAVNGRPEELFFAGELEGKVNSVGVSILCALKPTEIIGTCFSLNAGPAGIPLDGGFLGGILLTGGKGGINFKNSFSDPCDFEQYIDFGTGTGGESIPESADFPEEGEGGRDGENGGPPDMEELNDQIDQDLADNPDTSEVDPFTDDDELPSEGEDLSCILPTTPDFNCIKGPFPPRTINPLCERKMVGEEERIIFKETSLSEEQVLDLLELAFPDVAIGELTAHMDTLVPGELIDAFIMEIVGFVGGKVDQILEGDFDLDPETGDEEGHEFDPTTVDPRALAFFRSKLYELLGSVDDAASNFLREGFHRALKADPDASLYEILLQKASEGIPCFDVTLRLEGTFSHTAVSTVLSGTGAVTLSSTGTAMLQGKINLIGIPVGTGTLAYSITNENGNIDPSFGGVVEVALGPLELGRMTMSLGCVGCYDAVMDSLNEWAVDNADLFAGELGVFLIAMMDDVAPLRDLETGERAPRDPDISDAFTDYYNDLSEEEKFAWMSSFFNLFQVIFDNTIKVSQGMVPEPLPVMVTEETLEGFLNSFKPLLVNILTQVNPRICFGGDIGPKLFGFPLTGGANSSLGGGLLYQRVTDEATDKDFQELVAQIQFSPSQLFAAALLGSHAYSLPTAIDQANMGYSLRIPAFTEDNIETLLMHPDQFAREQVTTLVEDAVLSFGYQLQPLGYTLADGQGRMIMPRIDGHPLNPNRSRQNPDDPENPITLGKWENPDKIVHPENPDEPEDLEIPTRMELILAALSKGQLQNPLWRGTGPDLASLFALPQSSCYQPGEGCDLLTQEVAERINPERLAEMDMAIDYFPHGGLIGGAEMALPNMLAKVPPVDRLTTLLTVPTFETLGDWIINAQVLFGDPAETTHKDFSDPGYAYFTGTLCAGQMAFYLPAPNPPGFDWANGSPDEFIAQVQSGDFQGIVNRTLPAELYPSELILLSGWLDAPILGLPVARGMVNYDPDQGCFIMVTNVLNEVDPDGEEGPESPVPNWLFDLVGGSVEIQIKASAEIDQETGPENVPVGGPIERLATYRAQVTSIKAPIGLRGATQLITDLQNAMPKVSMLASANFQIPPGLENIFRADADASIEFFAFSPAFGPEFEPETTLPSRWRIVGEGWACVAPLNLATFPLNSIRNNTLLSPCLTRLSRWFPPRIFLFFRQFLGRLS